MDDIMQLPTNNIHPADAQPGTTRLHTHCPYLRIYSIHDYIWLVPIKTISVKNPSCNEFV